MSEALSALTTSKRTKEEKKRRLPTNLSLSNVAKLEPKK